MIFPRIPGVLALILLAGAVPAEGPLPREGEGLESALRELREARQERYRLEADWEKEKAELEQSSLSLDAEKELLHLRLKGEMEKKARLAGELEQRRLSLDEKRRPQGLLEPVIFAAAGRLKDAIEKSLRPPSEKKQALEELQSMLQEEAGPARRFQRLWDLYRAEIVQAGTITVAEGAVTGPDGVEMPVEFLRAGNLSLIYRGLDRKGDVSMAVWDDGKSCWTKVVDPGGRREIDKAFRIAQKKTRPEAVVLPLSCATIEDAKP